MAQRDFQVRSALSSVICVKIIVIFVVFHSCFKQCCPLGSSYLVGRVLSIGLQNSLSLAMVPWLISFHCFSGQELLIL